jgi:hypothetical protein
MVVVPFLRNNPSAVMFFQHIQLKKKKRKKEKKKKEEEAENSY